MLPLPQPLPLLLPLPLPLLLVPLLLLLLSLMLTSTSASIAFAATKFEKKTYRECSNIKARVSPRLSATQNDRAAESFSTLWESKPCRPTHYDSSAILQGQCRQRTRGATECKGHMLSVVCQFTCPCRARISGSCLALAKFRATRRVSAFDAPRPSSCHRANGGSDGCHETQLGWQQHRRSSGRARIHCAYRLVVLWAIDGHGTLGTSHCVAAPGDPGPEICSLPDKVTCACRAGAAGTADRALRRPLVSDCGS